MSEETKSKTKSESRVRILIPASENDDKPVKVGCNGNIIMIPRGVECDIPAGHFGVLKNAVETRAVGERDGVPILKDIPRFAYTVMGPAPAA